MQDFSNHPYIIKIDNLTNTIRNAISNGLSPIVIINGEYYEVDVDGEKLKEWKRTRKGR